MPNFLRAPCHGASVREGARLSSAHPSSYIYLGGEREKHAPVTFWNKRREFYAEHQMTARKPAEIAMQTVTPPVSWLPGEGGGSTGRLPGGQEGTGVPQGWGAAARPRASPATGTTSGAPRNQRQAASWAVFGRAGKAFWGRQKYGDVSKQFCFYRNSNPLKSKLMHLFKFLLYGI